MVYHNNQIHFAPTHSAEISIYNPRWGRDVKIYPRKPYQPIRVEHIRKMRAAYSNETWCRERNHHCDPERFDDHLAGEGVEVSNATKALAFVVNFDNKPLWSEAERWRLDGFQELRRYLRREGLRPELPDDLFAYLYADIARTKRAGESEYVLGLFKDDPELHHLLTAAFAAPPRGNRASREYFRKLDTRWDQPEIWRRLAKATESGPEFTQVVYVYRNVTTRKPIEYREILLSDLRARFGDIPLRACLQPPLLAAIFQKEGVLAPSPLRSPPLIGSRGEGMVGNVARGAGMRAPPGARAEAREVTGVAQETFHLPGQGGQAAAPVGLTHRLCGLRGCRLSYEPHSRPGGHRASLSPMATSWSRCGPPGASGCDGWILLADKIATRMARLQNRPPRFDIACSGWRVGMRLGEPRGSAIAP